MSANQESGFPASRADALKKIFEEAILFNRLLDMKVERLRRGFARLRIPYREELIGDPMRPALHGGVVSTLIDAAGGLAAFTGVRTEDRISTVDLRVDYLRPAALADLWAEATVLRVGNRVAVCDVVVYQSHPDRPVAVGKGVYSINRKPPPEESSPP